MLKQSDNAPLLEVISDRISRKRLKRRALARWENEGGAICSSLNQANEEKFDPLTKTENKPRVSGDHSALRK